MGIFRKIGCPAEKDFPAYRIDCTEVVSMCHKASTIGLVVLGIGAGLMLSFLFGGWFLRVLVALALIVLGFLLADCR